MTTATQAANGKLLNPTICLHVATHGPCTYQELFGLFVERGSTDTRAARSKRFAARLSVLRRDGLLKNISKASARGIYVVPEPEPAPVPYAWVPKVAPPPSYDVMHAPVYRTAPSAPMRPGADAFLHCPSRNGSQWVPHRTGYVAALASNHTTPTTPTTP